MEKELLAFCKKSLKGGQEHDEGDREQKGEDNSALSDAIDATLLVEAA